MTEFVTSADGTRIAYDRLGSGALAIILVGSGMNYRAFDPTSAYIATLLADQGFSVINYDRRGRGESGDTPPYSVDREVDDIAALLDVLDGPAALYGNSSGGALALWAAATPGVGERITGLALFEAGDRATLDRANPSAWAEQWASVTQPVLAMVGEETEPIFPPMAKALARALPNAKAIEIDAANHSVRPEVMAALLGGFLTGHEELATFAEYPDEPKQQV